VALNRGILPLRSRDWVSSGFEPGELVAPLICAAVILTLISIFASGVIWSVALLCWIWDAVKRKRIVLGLPSFYPWLIAFLGAVVVAIAASPDFLASLKYLEKFGKYFGIFLFFGYVTRSQIEKALYWIYGLAGASAAWALTQYFWFRNVDLMHRIDGFMSHWMTFSGQAMICSVGVAAYLLFRRRKAGEWKWLRPLLWLTLSVLVIACMLTMTRSAWIGLAGGMAVLLTLRRFRWVLPGLLLLLLVFVFLPAQFKTRLYSGFNLSDTTTRGRVELAETGIEMIRQHPWTGVGPRLVQRTALQMKGSKDYPPELFQHLHDNVLQIGAELGIPALLIWVGFWVRVMLDLWRFRSSEDEFLCFLAHAGLGVVVSVQLMGVFEYNFGDSEIAVLLFFIITVPYAVSQGCRLRETSR
jgi:putative inorganic carbon (HCO3(-)) transporter